MAISARLALQKAVLAKLRGTPAIVALVGKRIFDRVALGDRKPPKPYVAVGAGETNSDDAECIEAFEVLQSIDVWSDDPGYTEAEEIGDLVRRAIHEADLTLDGYVLNEIRYRATVPSRDADGLTSLVSIAFRALIETDDE